MKLRNSFVFAPLFRFCITLPFLYHCSVFALLFRFCNTVPFFHRFATDIIEYESRKLLCHPKNIVSSLRDRVLKEMEGEEVIDIPKSEDADNSRVLRAKLLASNDSIAFSAKLGVFVIAELLIFVTVWKFGYLQTSSVVDCPRIYFLIYSCILSCYLVTK